MDVNFDSCKDSLISNIYMPRLHTHVLFYNVVRMRCANELITMTSTTARFHLLRVLQYAALAADSMPPFFTFDSSSGNTRTTGLSITKMKPLFPWPFRNDFGFAVWIRVERFDVSIGNKRNPTLLFVQSDGGFGIHVSIKILRKKKTTGAFPRKPKRKVN
jgi:hypothetical protein